MEITGLDIALRRINTIERQFQSLANTANNLDGSFQKILDNAVQSSNAQNSFKSGTYGINSTTDKEKMKEAIEKTIKEADEIMKNPDAYPSYNSVDELMEALNDE